MTHISWAIVVFAAAAGLSWALRRNRDACAAVGVLGCLAGCGLGIYAALPVLAAHRSENRSIPWNLPYASFSLRLDGLASLFLCILFVVAIPVALACVRRVAGAWAANRPGEQWLFLNLLILSTALALLARNGVLFLLALGAAGICALLLAEQDWRDDRGGATAGAWPLLMLLLASGTALLAVFALAADGAVADLAAWREHPHRDVIVALGLVGFGLLLGWFPFHAFQVSAQCRLPDALAALWPASLGGVGVYGVFRILSATGAAGAMPAWPAWLLVAVGLAGAGRAVWGGWRSGTVEGWSAWAGVMNAGLVAIAVGVGCWACRLGSYAAAYPAFAGGLIVFAGHAAGAALFRLAGGDLRVRAGTGQLRWLGPWRGSLPTTARLALLGSLGSAFLPPLAGFLGAALLVVAVARLARTGAAADVPAIIVLGLLVALILAAALVWLRLVRALYGNRPAAGKGGSAEKPSGLLPLLLLAVITVFISISAGGLVRAVRPAVDVLVRGWLEPGAVDPAVPVELAALLRTVAIWSWGAAVLAGGVGALVLRRRPKQSRSAATPAASGDGAAPWGQLVAGVGSWLAGRPVGAMPLGIGAPLALLALLLAWRLWEVWR